MFDARGNGGEGGAGGLVNGKRAVKMKLEPCPGSLSTHISPPINSTIFLAIVRPRPVPPEPRGLRGGRYAPLVERIRGVAQGRGVFEATHHHEADHLRR